jgi:hypothetical protein
LRLLHDSASLTGIAGERYHTMFHDWTQ